MGKNPLIVIAIAALALACGEDAAVPSGLESEDVDGSYRLVRINGEALPFADVDGNCCVWTAGSLDLSSGDYVIEVVTRTVTDVVTFTITERGRYRLEEAGVGFEAESGEIVSSTGERQNANLGLGQGTLIADTLRVPFGENQLVGSFERRALAATDRAARR